MQGSGRTSTLRPAALSARCRGEAATAGGGGSPGSSGGGGPVPTPRADDSSRDGRPKGHRRGDASSKRQQLSGSWMEGGRCGGVHAAHVLASGAAPPASPGLVCLTSSLPGNCKVSACLAASVTRPQLKPFALNVPSRRGSNAPCCWTQAIVTRATHCPSLPGPGPSQNRDPSPAPQALGKLDSRRSATSALHLAATRSSAGPIRPCPGAASGVPATPEGWLLADSTGNKASRWACGLGGGQEWSQICAVADRGTLLSPSLLLEAASQGLMPLEVGSMEVGGGSWW